MKELKQFSPNAKVWIYQADRNLTEQERNKVRELGTRFAADWSAHGKDLNAHFEVFYDRFLVFFVDEGEQEATGCSIDRSVHFIKGLESNFDLDLMDRKQVAYKNGERIESLPFDRLDEALDSGKLSSDSIVFNNLVKTKGEFDKEWEIPLKDSWHARMLKQLD